MFPENPSNILILLTDNVVINDVISDLVGGYLAMLVCITYANACLAKMC